METVIYQWIEQDQAHDIAQLAVCLTEEIIERTKIKHFDVDIVQAEKLCRDFLEQDKYYVIAAFVDGKVIGFGALSESYALYAEGAFGVLQEFYVLPKYRSLHIGKALVQQIKVFASNRGWKRIELCTPPLPEFDRTVDFYQENGFERTGGYKMRWLV